VGPIQTGKVTLALRLPMRENERKSSCQERRHGL
jgi:hypothetical protein